MLGSPLCWNVWTVATVVSEANEALMVAYRETILDNTP